MADWALGGASRFESSVAISSRGSAGAKGSYVQLIASTAFAYEGLALGFSQFMGVATPVLADLAIGGAGSEVPIIPNMLIDTNAQICMNGSALIPVSIPAGSRLSVRHQETTGAGTRDMYWNVVGIGATHGMERGVSGLGVTYNADTANTNSTTAATPNASANTWGSWAQLTASTSAVHQHLLVWVGANKATTFTTGQYRVQIGVGAAGSEVGLFDVMHKTQSNQLLGPIVHSIPCAIPAGTRLAFRAQCDAASGSARSCVVIGF